MQKIRNIQCAVDEKNEEKDHFCNFWGLIPLIWGLRLLQSYRTMPKSWVLYFTTFGQVSSKFNEAFGSYGQKC